MKYAEARSRINSGDLLAWTSKGMGSWYEIQHHIIRILTESEYVHVACAWVIAGWVFLIEASGAGVRLYPLSRRLPCYWIPTGLVWSNEIEEYALSHVGDEFSKIRAWLAWMGKLKERSSKIKHPWECAEFYKSLVRETGVVLHCKATPSAVVHAFLLRGCSLSFIAD